MSCETSTFQESPAMALSSTLSFPVCRTQPRLRYTNRSYHRATLEQARALFRAIERTDDANSLSLALILCRRLPSGNPRLSE
jgi:hypothetical protein